MNDSPLFSQVIGGRVGCEFTTTYHGNDFTWTFFDPDAVEDRRSLTFDQSIKSAKWIKRWK